MKTAKKTARKTRGKAVDSVPLREITLEIERDMPYDPNDPIAVLSADERVYVQHRVMGHNATDSLRAAKPHWAAHASQHAWKWEHRPSIATAINHIQMGFSKHFNDALILSKEKRLILLSQAVMTPLSEIDADSIFCTEHKITENANGKTHSYKKEAMSTLIKTMGDVENGGSTIGAALSIGVLLGMMRKPGLPIGNEDESYLEDAA